MNMSGTNDDFMKGLNDDAKRKRAEDLLKTRLGQLAALAGKKGGKVIDLSALVGLLVTKAEFEEFRKTLGLAVNAMNDLLRKLTPKVDTSFEGTEVLGRLLATLERKEVITQEDMVETSDIINEAQARVREIHSANKGKQLSERLRLMREAGVHRLGLDEYEHNERKKAAARIMKLHGELKGKKGFRARLEIMRAENLPEEQVREYIVRFFPWKDGEGFKGAKDGDDLFCPECDQGLAVSGGQMDYEGMACPSCSRTLFRASLFLPEKEEEEVKAPDEKKQEPEGPKEFTPKLVE